jgi:zinc transporter ZupT
MMDRLDLLLEIVLIGLAVLAIGMNGWLFFRGDPAWRLTRGGNVIAVTAGLFLYLGHAELVPGSYEHILNGKLIIAILLAAIMGNALGRIIGENKYGK